MKKRPPAKSRGAASTPAPAPRVPGYDDILAIARLIESGSRFSEFRLRSGDIEVEVKRANGVVAEKAGPGPSPGPGQAVTPAQAGAQLDPGPSSSRTPGVTSIPDDAHIIKSPMVGTFYRAAEPGAKPFVEPGTKVEADSIVCIIEVMKLMNSVAAGVAGVVTHVFVENAAMVEHGQPLVAIRPK